MSIISENLRISKLRTYLIGVVTQIVDNCKDINADILSKDINSYSLDKIPTNQVVERWVDGTEIHRDVFSFRSRRQYSYKTIDNLLNIGFFEIFEKTIWENNKNKNLPLIDGISNIECLNCGTMILAETGTAEFDIQIQITYKTTHDEPNIESEG